MLLDFNPKALCAKLKEANGEPSTKPSCVYIYTIRELSDLFAILNLRALSTWGLKSLTLKGGSIFEILLNLSEIFSITLSISSVEFFMSVLYLLLRTSEISKNNFLPSVK